MATLRGAQVEVDARRVSRVVAGACLVVLAGLVVGLFAAGANKNAEITALRDHGSPVEVTVTRCLGLLGGSGSNDAGYACRGSFDFRGRRYVRAIPGGAYYAPGAKVQAVVSKADPGLLSTARAVAAERPSWTVFALPTVLLVVFLALLAIVTARTRRDRVGAPPLLPPSA